MRMRLELAGHVMDAHSVGGSETCFQLPSFDLCLDIGRCPDGAENRSRLLLTHGHIDHASGLPYYVSLRSLMSMKPPQIFCPNESRTVLQRILEEWDKLQSDATKCTLTGVNPGHEIDLGKNAVVRTFASPHRIATIGYTIFTRVKKLKPELRGTDETEIARLAKKGKAVSSMEERPEICFPGDTMIEVVETEPTVTKARVLLLECTFVGKQVSVEKARRAGHIHLDEIAERADLFENEVILLTHFSKRHGRTEIEKCIEKQLPERLRKRVRILLDR